MEYKFKPFTNDLTPHAQLQEWANHYHVNLEWNDEPTQTNGIPHWTTYPIIQGVSYPGFVGAGGVLKDARAVAAERIINCSSIL
ncbi:hypothetical protein RhiJN_25449 [Ceratobasidium sp. AG-Ba]|nr:hypothetical protein RhiJN_25449 [Ceratobasidium sp. AG-Ba]